MNSGFFLKRTVTLLALAGVSGTLARGIAPRIQAAPTGMNRTQLDRMDQVAAASLFGQFRSSMADFLWLKVDKYLHSGVDMRGLTELEKEGIVQTERVSNAGGKDAEGQRTHASETTVVPSSRHDWRGQIGNLEREIIPYQNMEHHRHRDPTEALPLFRLMTLSNPHFIPGYVTGAAMIARTPKEYSEAMAFLQEGEKNNPESIEIQEALGQMYTAKIQDFARGFPYLNRALLIGAARDPQTLTEDETEAYRDSFRWMVLNRREAGDRKIARQAALAGLKLFPGDIVCTHFLNGNEAASRAAAPDLKGVD